MAITLTPGEFRDHAAAWDRRAKEATSAEDHKMMLYAAAGCRERADEVEGNQQRSVIRLDDRRGGARPGLIVDGYFPLAQRRLYHLP